ncbi:hypothetical protein A4R35_00065 [Thermogemmatispora tikiterensis]|uniref:Uncharacterized protein n=1 Tax=Thermogemmatispora tikiterensis TaxID=1825093 RepID=A0A328VF18_9CHLR|nr:hypothetical protein A4R35_00065 [Thermogemmatispora tikiterensis]
MLRHHPGFDRRRPVSATAPPPEALRAGYLQRGQEEMWAWTRSLRQRWEAQRAAQEAARAWEVAPGRGSVDRSASPAFPRR